MTTANFLKSITDLTVNSKLHEQSKGMDDKHQNPVYFHFQILHLDTIWKLL